MSLFNFNEENEEENFNQHATEEIECQCDECSIMHTLDLVDSFTELTLSAKSVEELYSILYQFAELSKIQGIKEYLFDDIDDKMDVLLDLDVFTKSVNNNENIIEEDDFDFYGGFGDIDIPHWKDRM